MAGDWICPIYELIGPKCHFVLDMTGLVLNMTGLVIKITEFVLNTIGFVLFELYW